MMWLFSLTNSKQWIIPHGIVDLAIVQTTFLNFFKLGNKFWCATTRSPRVFVKPVNWGNQRSYLFCFVNHGLHVFDEIHWYLWGPAIVSWNNFKYYVGFVDDHSRFIWYYPLINKSEFFCLRGFWENDLKLILQNQTRRGDVFAAGLALIQPVWFDRVGAKWVLLCFCKLRYWACPLLSFIRSALIAKLWSCYCFECLVGLGLRATLESCHMHLWCTL